MGKTTNTNNSKVKRKLITELEACASSETKKRKSSRETEPLSRDSRSRGKQQPFSLPSTSSDTSKNNELVVEFVTKNNKRDIVSQAIGKFTNKCVKARQENKIKCKVKSKVVVPKKPLEIDQNCRSRSKSNRTIKPPIRFLDSDQVVSKNKNKVQQGKMDKTRKLNLGKKPKQSVNAAATDEFLQDEFENIDVLTNSEIVDGNNAAGIDHDGVELSINGSDIDDFSDEETVAEQEQGSSSNPTYHEPGEIVSSDEESSGKDAGNGMIKTVRKPASKTAANQIGTNKYQHLQHDPDFNKFLDQMLDRKLAKGNNVQKAQNDLVKQKRVEQSKLIKSPSDTTLYSPGLRRANIAAHVENNGNNCDDIAIQNISNFVDNMRIENRNDRNGRDGSDRAHSSHQSGYDKQRDVAGTSVVFNPRFDDSNKRIAQHQQDTRRVEQRQNNSSQEGNLSSPERSERTTDQLLLQAEKFKARVEAPKGMCKGLLMPYDYEQLRTKFVTSERTRNN